MGIARRIIKLAALLLAGAAISIAIAEAASIWSYTLCIGSVFRYRGISEERETNPSLIARQEMMEARLLRINATTRGIDAPKPRNPILSFSFHSGFAIEVDEYRLFNISPRHNLPSNFEYCEVQAGWPFRCMIATSVRLGEPTREWRDAIPAPKFLNPAPFTPTPPRPPRPDDLPTPLMLRFIPSGLALNTAIFASALWTLFFTRATLTTTLRRRRNRCPACNYHRAGLAADALCPECGLTSEPSLSSPPAASLSSSPQASAASGPNP